MGTGVASPDVMSKVELTLATLLFLWKENYFEERKTDDENKQD
jgi:hypothetical protein